VKFTEAHNPQKLHIFLEALKNNLLLLVFVKKYLLGISTSSITEIFIINSETGSKRQAEFHLVIKANSI
jgi:hypothetical protein